MAKLKIRNPLFLAIPGTDSSGSEITTFPALPEGTTNLSTTEGSSNVGGTTRTWLDARRDIAEVTFDMTDNQESTTTAGNRGFYSEEAVESRCAISFQLIPDRGLKGGLYNLLADERRGTPAGDTVGKFFVVIGHKADSDGLPIYGRNHPIFMARLTINKLMGGGRVNTLAKWSFNYQSDGEFTYDVYNASTPADETNITEDATGYGQAVTAANGGRPTYA